MKIKRLTMFIPFLFLTIMPLIINTAQQDEEAQEENQKLQKELFTRNKKFGLQIIDTYFAAMKEAVEYGREGITPLMKAVYWGDKEKVENLINQEKVHVNDGDFFDRTAPFFTLRGSNLKMLKLLVKHGVNLGKRDKEGFSVLELAYIQWGLSNEKEVEDSKTPMKKLQMLKFLLDKSDKETAIQAAYLFEQVWNDETVALEL